MLRSVTLTFIFNDNCNSTLLTNDLRIDEKHGTIQCYVSLLLSKEYLQNLGKIWSGPTRRGGLNKNISEKAAEKSQRCYS